MFALLDLSEEGRGISLKCDPELAISLRERHPEVTTAYHFNKKHWNGVSLSGNLTKDQVFQWIDHSYKLVADSLPHKLREQFKLD